MLSGSIEVIQKYNRGSINRRERENELEIEREMKNSRIDHKWLKKPCRGSTRRWKRETCSRLMRLTWREPKKVKWWKGELNRRVGCEKIHDSRVAGEQEPRRGR
jgi:hypothetical protein